MDTTSRINEMEQSIKTIAEFVKKQTEDLKRQAVTMNHLEELESRVERKYEDVEEMKNRYSELDNSLSELKSTMSKRPAGTDNKKLDEMERRIEDLSRISKNMPKAPVADNKIAGEVDNLVKDIYKVRKALDEETAQRIATDKDMQDLKEKVGELGSTSKKGFDSSRLMDSIQKEISSLRSEMNSKTPAKTDNSTNEMRKEIAYIRNEIASSSRTPAASFTDMERKELKLVKAELEAVQQTMGRFQASLEKLKDMKGIDTYEELAENVNDIRRTVDEESVQRIATDKNLQDIRQKMEDILFAVNKFKGFEEIDFSKLKSIMQEERKFDNEAEKKIDMQASKIVTRQLNDFSRNLDKRLPNLVTRDDLAKLEARLIKSPRPAAGRAEHLDDRLAALEFTINTMLHELRATGGGNSKHPFVIE